MKTLTSVDERCIGCRLCEVACAMKHFEVGNPKKSAIKVYQKFPKPAINEPVFCRQCTFPPCVLTCASKALSKGRNGVIKLDPSKCDDCGSCVKGCPFGAIFTHKELSHPIICDLCNGDPECAKICPSQAIRYVPEGAVGEARRTWLIERQDSIPRRI
jgi:anaerobic carbon-monoxide dehydrogenase iron sulfur subunit